jgi:hypothetical protein
LTERHERCARETDRERAGTLREVARPAPHADHETRKRENEREAGAGAHRFRNALRDFSLRERRGADVEQRWPRMA